MEEPSARRALTTTALAALALLLAPLFLAPDAEAQSTLVISGDAALAAAAHAGAGTAQDPYRIRGLVVSAASGHGIQVSNTRAHLVIEGVTVASGGGAYDGIRLTNVQNVTVADALLEGDNTAILVSGSGNVTIERTTAKTSRTGVLLERSRDVTLADNRLSVNDRDVVLRQSWDNRFLRNNLTIAAQQTGFHFEDAASYRNDIGTSNVVNFLPVQWYTHPCPARISGVAMELKGVTNVAQVMLHGCQGTLVEGVRAKDGLKAGVHLIDAGNVTLSRLTVEGNAGPGVHVERGGDARLDNATLRANQVGLRVEDHGRMRVADALVEANREQGLLAQRGDNMTLHRVSAVRNGGAGLSLVLSPDATLAAPNATGNQAAGVHLDRSPRSLVENGAMLDNAGAGLSLSGASARVEGNRIAGNPNQVHLASARGGEFRANVLSLREGQTGYFFADEVSYANLIHPTNTVEGVPMRWYHDALAPAGAPTRVGDFNVSLRGITNVAQVMVHASRNLTLENVTASNGSAHGILILGSSNVTVSASTMDANARSGLFARDAPDARVAGSDARDNREDGLSFTRASAATVENGRVQGNLGRGVALEGSPFATLRGISASNNRGVGIHLARSLPDPALVENNVVQGNAGGGILVQDAAVGTMRANLVADNGADGVTLQSVPPGARLVQNEVRNHTRDVRLAASKGVELRENRLNISPGQTGFHFDDETSHNVTLDTTNTVNGVAVRWYNEVRATADAPLTLTGVRVELPGITNVAQIYLRRAENVTLQDALLSNGTHRGLVAVESSNLSVVSTRLLNNSLDGMHARQSKDVLLQNVQAHGNRGHGVVLVSTDRLRADATSARDNAQQGLRLETTSAHLERVHAYGNGDTGLAAAGFHEGGLTVRNGTFAHNRGNGVRLDNARLLHLADSVIDANKGQGAWLAGGRFDHVERNRWTNNTLGGLRVDGARGNVTDNALFDNGETGILLVNAPAGGRVEANLLVNHTKGLALQGTRDWRGDANRVHLSPTGPQFGVHLADETSYQNAFPATNLVNGTPLRWYYDLAGPLVLEGVSVEWRGMMNVAQALVVESRGIELRNATFANGTGHGVLLHGSTGVTLAGGRVENNTKDGVRAHLGGSHTLRDLALRGNGDAGLHLQGSGGNALRGALVEGNGAGVRSLQRSGLNEVADTRVANNTRGGVELDEALTPRVLRVDLSGNGPFGLSLSRTAGIARVEDATFERHARHLRLATTEYGEFHRTNVTLGGGETAWHFEDETSYNNVIPPSNVVSGTPMRWYVGLTGTESSPVALRDIRVELGGITNVAQVMVHRSSYVTLENVTASRGVARGIELYHSSGIVLLNASAVGNADGIQLTQTRSSRLVAPEVASNGRGVKLVGGGNNLLLDVRANYTDVGVLVDAASTSNRIVGTYATGARTASVQDPSVSGLRGNNVIVDAGLDRRVLVDKPLRLDGALVSARFETERVTLQRWEFGDGAPAEESRDNAPFRPQHTYARTGAHLANLTVHTADGGVHRDAMVVTVLPPLSEPTNVQGFLGDKNVTLRWGAPVSDGASPVTKHRIYRGEAPDNLTVLADVGLVSQHLDQDKLVNGRTYHYAVAAFNADGIGPRSAVVSVTPGAVPSAPKMLGVRAGDGNLTVSWEAPADDGGRHVTGYRVLRGPTAHDLRAYADAGNATSYTDTLVANGLPYWYAVVAVNALGQGAPSAAASATPAPFPAAPTNLQALPAERHVTLVWDHALRPGDGAVQKFRIHRGEGPDNMTLLAESAGREHRDATALQGVRYHYAVSAVNDAGEGPRSAPATAQLQERDTLKPILLGHGPAADVVHAGHPGDVWVEYLDNLGVVASTVKLEVDGRDVTAQANPTDRAARYVPTEPFAPGNHTARLTATDAAGNTLVHEWTFRVVDPAAMLARWEFFALNATSERVALGESVLVTARVRNVGGAAGTTDANLTVDGATADAKPVTLEPGAETDVSFRFKPTLAGRVNVSVGDQPPMTIVVVDETLPLPGAVPDGAMPLTEDEPESEEKKRFLPAPGLLVGVLAGVGAALLARRRRA